MFQANDTIGPYTLLDEIGKGGFGIVWRAEWQSPNGLQQVAVKFPTNIDHRALLTEVVTWLKAGEHENVLPFVDATYYGNQAVIVSEYAPDGSLGGWLKRHGGRAPTIMAAGRMALGILAGLEHLHARKIIHRDIKPDNVLLKGDTPRLADFGLSRVLDLVQSSTIAGTLYYMPPEAWDEGRTEQADLWAVGVVLYQLLTGVLPFTGRTNLQIMKAICEKQPDLSPLPPQLKEFVACALEKDLSDRFATATEMRGELQRILNPQVPPTVSFYAFETPTVDANGKVVKTTKGRAQYDIEDLGGGVGLEMVALAGGTFQMGSPETEDGRYANEGPQYPVTLSPFHIGKYPVTQAQWRAVAQLPQVKAQLSPDPSYFKGDNLPVETVSWEDAIEFCARLSAHTGRAYRLPTEAEWEYACRAGTKTPFAFGPTLTSDLANYGVNIGQTTQVGRFPPNAFGLSDMHGNVWEWCADWYGNYPAQLATNPSGPTTGSGRVDRGGSWYDRAVICRSARRGYAAPGLRYGYLGCRLSRTPA